MWVKNPVIKMIFWSFSPLPDRAQFWLSHYELSNQMTIGNTSWIIIRPVWAVVWYDFFAAYAVEIKLPSNSKDSLSRFYKWFWESCNNNLCIQQICPAKNVWFAYCCCGILSCLIKPKLYCSRIKPFSNRHYIFRHIFKWFYAIKIQILCIQQISPM